MPLVNSQARQRIGIFGGTFDPIHLGHLAIAAEAHQQLQLDGVYFVPAGDPPHKQTRQITPVAQRLCMLELATAEVDCFWVSRVDADRPGPHYSSDMVRLLRAELGDASELFFLMGMDSLLDLPTWHEPEWLLNHCQLVIFNRPGNEPDWATLEANFPNIRQQITLLTMPQLEISSSAIRQRLATRQNIRFYLPPLVEAYVRKHCLYQ
jgi:nicotinate-nucleotide adenylyltransferase